MTKTDDPEWVTAIAEVQGDDVLVRGHRLSDLIPRLTYSEMVFLVFRGTTPAESERRMLDALLVSLTEHGISPSTMIVRTLASCGTPIQAGLAGGIMSIADWHGGACERLAEILATASDDHGRDQAALRASLAATVAKYRASRTPMEGFGHPQHRDGDPRARQLLELAAELEVAGSHCAVMQILGDELSASLSRPMPANVNGAVAAIVLDLGFPWQSVRGFVIAPRTLGLAAHYVEELQQGGRWRHAPAERVRYTGPREPQDARER